ncbi:tyrosine-protein phosphatase non-receptor type, partial [Elysia marginata]
MPFKWRLKKARKYDLSTKNLFIVGVYQLDNSYLECTLNAESTGQECLNSIAQRIELSENHFFGLRYVTKKLHFHWVDLEKPLKKQLDKHAQPANHCHCLYFGVMFYVLGAHKISDEVARYHYYLQLKNDIIDGRLPCSSEQAIRLAAYSLQAEFGDYEPDKYAAEDYLLFPKTMMKDETITAELFSEAVAGHASLQGVPPIRAELQYVKEVQVMDGYGAEYYSAKDESRKDLYLGTSYAGIFARYIDGQSTVYYKWTEIAKVTQNKKTLEIDSSKSSVQFQLEDSDSAKYVSRLAQLQCKFYKSGKGNLRDAQQVYIPPTDYSSHSSQELAHSQTSLTHLQEQRHSQDPAYGSHQSSLQSLESSEAKQQPHQLQQQQFHSVGRSMPNSTPTSSSSQHHFQNPTQHHALGPLDSVHHQIHSGSNHIYSQQGMRYENLTPTPDGGGDPVYVNRAALLPAYRPSPDYDIVMQQRLMMQQQQQQQQQQHPQQSSNQSYQHLQHQQHHHLQPHFEEIASSHLGAAQVYVHPEGMAYSQPEIRHNTHNFRSNSFSIGNSHNHEDEHGNYANVDALKNYSIYANIFQDHPHHGHYQVGRSGSISGATGGGGVLGHGGSLVHPTYSSPDLHTGGETLIHSDGNAFTSSSSSIPGNPLLTQESTTTYHQYRPPPPYPRTSSSTPDLAVVASSAPIQTLGAEAGLQLQQNQQPEEKNEYSNQNSLLHQAQLGHSIEDLSMLQALQNSTPQPNAEPIEPALSTSLPVDQEITRIGEDCEQQNLDSHVSKDNVTVENERRTSDASIQNSSARSSLRGTNELPLVKESLSKVLSDDPDDTSSEHSYSTFHAKESDESSDDEEARPKVALESQQREEPKIQIKMFAPDEAPPMSKIKEEATLRESFRRMKIARTGSLSKEGPVLKRSSLRGLKELGGPSTLVHPAPLNVVCEQPQDSGSIHIPENFNEKNKLIPVDTPEMEEVLDQLGDPPPYPGSQNLNIAASENTEQLSKNKVTFEFAHNNNVEDKKINLTEPIIIDTKDVDIRSDKTTHEPQVKTNLKRSSSTGNPSPTSSDIPVPPPPRREPITQKQGAATFNLDTVVPLSKPGMVRFLKEGSSPDMGTSVLRSEVTSTNSTGLTGLTESDSGSSKSYSDHDKEESSNDNMTSLNDYSIGSDSDSEHDKTLTEGLNVGPLKMAAMNGLTLSRSVVLSLMNDESRAPTDDRRRMLESKISEGQVYAEFEKIPRKSSTLECSVAKSSQNTCRNRFKDVLPYDATRVKLTPRKDNPDGYINASNLKLTANENRWLFIATQAPLENTAQDFWQMVWENGVHVLAMLTPFQESGKSKCFVYWPQEQGPQHKQVFGEYEVELEFTDDSLCYLTSRIILRHNGRQHLVWHLQYTDWPDHGCPDDTYGFLGFLDEIESVARLAENESDGSQKAPVVVHCSAGVGRTGVVILTMVMKWCLEHNH